MDSAGNGYVADTYNHTIRKVTTAGVVTTLAGLAGEYGHADEKGRSLLLTQVQVGLVVWLGGVMGEPVGHIRPGAHVQLGSDQGIPAKTLALGVSRTRWK
ncbi:MAG: hypothetical protein EXS31_13515 [Pedosphaera sp.]|nr:hypothetical protein [Pedosphaera sp.]